MPCPEEMAKQANYRNALWTRLMFFLSDQFTHFYARNQLLLSAHLSHRTSVCLSVRPSVTRVDQSKTVHARITKSSLSAARKTLVSGTVKLHCSKRGQNQANYFVNYLEFIKFSKFFLKLYLFINSSLNYIICPVLTIILNSSLLPKPLTHLSEKSWSTG